MVEGSVVAVRREFERRVTERWVQEYAVQQELARAQLQEYMLPARVIAARGGGVGQPLEVSTVCALPLGALRLCSPVLSVLHAVACLLDILTKLTDSRCGSRLTGKPCTNVF